MYAPKLSAVLGGFALYGTVAGLSVGVATGAPTQTDGAMLYMCQDAGNPSSYRITVNGVYPTTATTSEGYLQAGPGGLEYRREMVVPRPNFNEDYKQPASDDDVDEIYAVVTFRDGDGGERPAVTQSITRNFEVSGICDGCCH